MKSYATISRTAVQSPGTLAPLDISAHNVLTFYLTVGDNGAWTDYRDHVEIRLNNNGTTVAIPREDVNAALTDVVPGTEIKITIPLKGLYKEQLNAIAEIWVGVTDASSEKNLHLKIRRVQAETDENYPAVPEQRENRRRPIWWNSPSWTAANIRSFIPVLSENSTILPMK